MKDALFRTEHTTIRGIRQMRGPIAQGTIGRRASLTAAIPQFERWREAMIWRRRRDNRVEPSSVEARQGYLDRPVLIVLLISTGLAVLALGLLLVSA